MALIPPFSQPVHAPFLALVRHAPAARAREGEADSERALTAEGRASFAAQVERLTSIAFRCDVLWTSPWRRARETAQMLRGLSATAPQDKQGLCAEQDTREARELREAAAETARNSRVVLVGHDPWLVELAHRLGASDVGELEKGEIVWLTARSTRSWGVAARLVPTFLG